MAKVKKNKGKKHSNTRKYDVTSNSCNELKMFQLFKNDDKDQSHSLVFKISKTSPVQTFSSSNTASSNEDRKLLSHYVIDFTENTEANYTKAESSLLRNEHNKTSDHNPLKSLDDNKNQSHHLESKASITSETQAFTNDNINEDKITNNEDKACFSQPEVDCTEKFEKNDMESPNLLIQISQSPTNEKVKTGDLELQNLNDGENKLHCLEFKISEASEIHTPRISTALSSSEKDTKFSSYYEDEINIKFESNDTETGIFLDQVSHLPAIENEITCLFKPQNVNDVKNQESDDSPVLKIAISSEVQTPANFPAVSNNKNVTYSSFGEVESTENFQESYTETSVEMSLSPAIQREIASTDTDKRRRSLRLLELQSKLNSPQELGSENLSVSLGNTTKKKTFSKVKRGKRKSLGKNNRGNKKQAKKRKSSLNSTFPSPMFIRRMESEMSHGSSFIHPSSMKLKSMMLIPPSRESLISSSFDTFNYPTFANVDPSEVLTSLADQVDITKSLASGKIISLYFPNQFHSQSVRSEQNYFSPTEKSVPQYNFKKKIAGLLYLSKKYPMMDPFTLDMCYGKPILFRKIVR